MRVLSEVTAKLQDYFIRRDGDSLREAMRMLNAELSDPSLQEAIITVPDSLEAVETTITKNGFLRLTLDEADSDKAVIADKFVRVFSAQDPGQNGCMVLNVAVIDDTQIILVPFMGG